MQQALLALQELQAHSRPLWPLAVIVEPQQSRSKPAADPSEHLRFVVRLGAMASGAVTPEPEGHRIQAFQRLPRPPHQERVMGGSAEQP